MRFITFFGLVASGGCYHTIFQYGKPCITTSANDERMVCGVTMNDALRIDLRLASGKEAEPSAGTIDCQSVKTTEAGVELGFDAGKRIKGRKRHILVDTMGLLLFARVLTANIQDCNGAKVLFEKVKERFPRFATGQSSCRAQSN